MLRNKSRVVLLGVLVFVGGTWAFGQLRPQPTPRNQENNEYRVTVDSTGYGIPHTVGFFGRQDSAQIRIRFDGGRAGTGPDITTVTLFGGERMVCVWDTSGNILFYSTAIIDRRGTLFIPGGAGRGAAVGADGGAGAAMGDQLRVQ
jgi:hypothetical protein